MKERVRQAITHLALLDGSGMYTNMGGTINIDTAWAHAHRLTKPEHRHWRSYLSNLNFPVLAQLYVDTKLPTNRNDLASMIAVHPDHAATVHALLLLLNTGRSPESCLNDAVKVCMHTDSRYAAALFVQVRVDITAFRIHRDVSLINLQALCTLLP